MNYRITLSTTIAFVVLFAIAFLWSFSFAFAQTHEREHSERINSPRHQNQSEIRTHKRTVGIARTSRVTNHRPFLDGRTGINSNRVCDRYGNMASRRGNNQSNLLCSEPTPDRNILVTEVYYDVDAEHGSEGSGEWVELYNTTSEAVDISGWIIADASSEDVIPDATIVDAGGFVILTATDSLRELWDIPSEVPVVNLGSSIGNGLGNTGDALWLKDASSTTIDSLSWGTNTEVFDPSVPDAPEGFSLVRNPIEVDTDTASDWIRQAEPTPGQTLFVEM